MYDAVLVEMRWFDTFGNFGFVDGSLKEEAQKPIFFQVFF